MKLSVGLIHHPVLDSARNLVATNITNLDVHDIARVCKVYGVERYYIVHPMKEQQMFVWRMLDHWRTGEGARLNPMRKTALTMVHTANTVTDALQDLTALYGVRPLLVGTSARELSIPRLSFKELKERVREEPIFLIFGTGFGMTEELLSSCDFLLEALKGAPPLDYRHLSVRSAVSICLDRLQG